MDELTFFSDAKPRTKPTMAPVFADDTRHPGVIHARVLYCLTRGFYQRAIDLVASRPEAVQDSTYELLLLDTNTRRLIG